MVEFANFHPDGRRMPLGDDYYIDCNLGYCITSCYVQKKPICMLQFRSRLCQTIQFGVRKRNVFNPYKTLKNLPMKKGPKDGVE